MKQEIIVGVDIGGTTIEAGCIINKQIARRFSLPTKASRHKEDILDTLFTVIDDVLVSGSLAIGVGVPGLYNTRSGEIVSISNIPSWKNLNLVDELNKRFNLPVLINNDANCFALGEKHFGKGLQHQNMVGIALGTGVGSGIIINGKLHTGMLGGAGEIGFCPCQDKTFEYFCGSSFFTEEYNISGEECYNKAIEGDLGARKIFHEFGLNIGSLLECILYTFAPEAIIIGGSISKAFPYFIEGIHEKFKSFAFKEMIDLVQIEQSELNDIAILGAAGLHYNAK